MANEISIVVKGNSLDAQRALDATTKSQKQLGDQARQTGRDFVMEAAGAKILDRQIDDLKGNMRRLVVDIANVSDESEKVKLTEKFKVDQSAHAELSKLRRVLSDAGSEGGRSFFQSLRDGLGSLPSELKGAAIAAAVTAGIAAAPFVGAAIGGAVLGGVGVGGIVGGVALAAQDPAIQAAGIKLRDGLLGDLRQASQSFIAPLLSSFDELRSAGKSLSGELAGGFSKLAPMIEPLAAGVEKLVDNLGPGLSDAFDKAGPVLKVIADELPALGDSISYALSAIAEESDGATMGLAELFHIVEYGIEVTGDFIAAMSATFEWLVRTTDAAATFGEKILEWSPLMGVTAELLGAVSDETGALIEGLEKSKEPIGGLTGGLYEIGQSSEEAKKATDALKRSFDDLFGIQMSLDEANIRYQESIDETMETLKEGKRTLDINTEAGRENKDAVLNQVGAIEDLRQANIDNGMAVDEANRIYGTQLGQLEKTLLKLGFNKQQVNALIEAYKNVPKNVTTQVAAPGLAALLERLREVDRLFRATEGYHEYRAGERSGHAFGGATSSAQTGGARGGLTQINEMGPELARLPDGSIVIPSGQSVQMMEALAGTRRSMPPAGAVADRAAVAAGLGVTRLHPDDLRRLGKIIAGAMSASLGAANEVNGRRADLYRRTG